MFNIEPMKGYGEAELESGQPGHTPNIRPTLGSIDPFLFIREEQDSAGDKQPGMVLWAASSERTGRGGGLSRNSPGKD